MIQVRERHRVQDTVNDDIEATQDTSAVICDSCAVTIASWWQSPGRIGYTLASFASGCPVTKTALLEDIQATITLALTNEAKSMGKPKYDVEDLDLTDLAALRKWVMARAA